MDSERTLKLIKSALSYAFSNVDEVNDACGTDFTEDEIDFLQVNMAQYAATGEAVPIKDAHDDSDRMLTIRPDQHGVCIGIDQSEQLVVLDLAAGDLRVFIAENFDADIVDEVGRITK